jgi:integrase/recombinase XerD
MDMTTLAHQIDSFLDDAVHRLGLKHNTIRAYRYDLRRAGAHLTDPLDVITQAQVETHLGQQSPTSRPRRTASLRRFFAWAVRQGLCQRNPVDGLEPLRVKRRLPRPVRTISEREALEKAIAAAPQPHRLVLTLLRETGMRVGEALGLNIGDVILDVGREGLRIREPKNNIERIVVLGPNPTWKSLRGLRAHLRVMGKQPEHAPLFRSNRGTRLTYDAIYYQWAHVCEAASLLDEHGKPRYTLHQLRHTRATELVEQGQRMESVQRVLGHRDPRSTQVYAELNEERVRAALE